jgi:hypothetical protein
MKQDKKETEREKEIKKTWEEINNLSDLIKMGAVKQAHEQTLDEYMKVNEIQIAYNQKENYYAIGYENTKDPDITLDIGKQCKIFLDLLSKHDRELLLKSLLICSIQSDLTYKIQYQALNDLKKQEADLI